MDKQFAIFDMDGTLVDSMIFWKQLASEFLESKGVTEIPEDILERIRPMTITESAQLFQEEFGLSGTPESIAAEMNELMDIHYRTDIPLKPGMREYLNQLHQKGTRMCVASATAQPLMSACLERLGVLDFFEFLLSCEEVGSGKNNPDVYFAAAARLGAAPADIAVYEDALYAVQTAKKAGFYTVGVYDESTNEHWAEIITLSDEIIGNKQEERTMSASIAIQILPQAEDDQEVCRIVDEAIAYIASTGLRYEVGPFETTIEGDDFDQLMEIARNCQYVALQAGTSKVTSYIKTVFRPEGPILTIDQKIGKYKK